MQNGRPQRQTAELPPLRIHHDASAAAATPLPAGKVHPGHRPQCGFATNSALSGHSGIGQQSLRKQTGFRAPGLPHGSSGADERYQIGRIATTASGTGRTRSGRILTGRQPIHSVGDSAAGQPPDRQSALGHLQSHSGLNSTRPFPHASGRTSGHFRNGSSLHTQSQHLQAAL